MTDREKQLIEAYIPSPRDTALKDFEYYVKDSNDRVQKVEITDMLPFGETMLYRVVQVDTRKQIKNFRKYDTFAMCDMYDNKTDCRDNTHIAYDNWERLREIQRKETELQLQRGEHELLKGGE